MKRYIPLIILIILFQAVGGILGTLTAPEIDGWYNALVKSPLNPPSYAFGIVWPILYVMLAIAFWMVWKREESDTRRSILVLFTIHMLLNWAWTPVFFTLHQPLGGLIILIAIVLTALVLIRMLWNYERRAAWMLVPYIAWISFATHLNYYIWHYN